MTQEASKRRCDKIKFISLSFVSKLFSQKILRNFIIRNGSAQDNNIVNVTINVTLQCNSQLIKISINNKKQ